MPRPPVLLVLPLVLALAPPTPVRLVHPRAPLRVPTALLAVPVPIQLLRRVLGPLARARPDPLALVPAPVLVLVLVQLPEA